MEIAGKLILQDSCYRSDPGWRLVSGRSLVDQMLRKRSFKKFSRALAKTGFCEKAHRWARKGRNH